MNRFFFFMALLMLIGFGVICVVATSPPLGVGLLSATLLLLLHGQPKDTAAERSARRHEALQRAARQVKQELARENDHVIEQYFVLEQEFRRLGEGHLADEMHDWGTVLKEAQELEQALAKPGVRKGKTSAPVPSSGSMLDPPQRSCSLCQGTGHFQGRTGPQYICHCEAGKAVPRGWDHNGAPVPADWGLEDALRRMNEAVITATGVPPAVVERIGSDEVVNLVSRWRDDHH